MQQMQQSPQQHHQQMGGVPQSQQMMGMNPMGQIMGQMNPPPPQHSMGHQMNGIMAMGMPPQYMNQQVKLIVKFCLNRENNVCLI